MSVIVFLLNMNASVVGLRGTGRRHGQTSSNRGGTRQSVLRMRRPDQWLFTRMRIIFTAIPRKI
jgi:hypothetical protein